MSTVIAIGLSMVAAAAAQTTYEILHAFRNSGQPSTLIRAGDGHLYGTTCWGGAHGVGTIFRIDASNKIIELHSFGPLGPLPPSPCSTLMQANTGDFYGTTVRGGENGYGTVFKIDESGNFMLLHSFTEAEGAWPSGPLLQASDGNLYGTTSLRYVGLNGTLFRMDLSGNLVVLHAFGGGQEGARPSGALVQAPNGDIYGTTLAGGPNDKGTVFKMDSSNTLTTVHSFTGNDGSQPERGLIQAVNGDLLGTTSAGGANGLGTIFRIDSVGDFTSLHSFTQLEGTHPGAIAQGTDDDFYGGAAGGGANNQGTIFRMTPSGEVTTLHSFAGADGSQPIASFVKGDGGQFFGATQFGGVGGVGAVFSTDEAGSVGIIASFENTGAGIGEPSRFIQGSDGNLYATSSGGGENGTASIFRMDLSGNITILHGFAANEGAGPFSSLLEAADGQLYGTAAFGGAHSMGTIFSLDLGGGLSVRHDFNVDDGALPAAALIQDSGGNLFGTTQAGGQFGDGTVFVMDGTGTVTTLHDFATPDPEFPDGANPLAPLILASNGYLYGTTRNGGSSYLGTVFNAVTSGGAAPIYSFDSIDGAHPISGLIEGSDGKLYGTTPYIYGTIFRLTPPSGDFETLHSFRMFDDNDGSEPQDGIIEAPDGNFYGTTFMGGDFQAGTIFKMDTSGAVTRIHNFHRLDGGYPVVGLTQASDGKLYGSASGGPWGGQGVIFRLSNAVVALNQVFPGSGPASGGTTIDLIGGGFVPNATVTIGGFSGTDQVTADPTFIYLLTPVLSPGTLNDLTVTVPNGFATASACKANAFFADFLDLPQTDPFHDYVEKIVRNGVTAGCGAGNYCPADAVTRAQMAVFLLKSKHGSAYIPPFCTGLFGDVSCPSMFADWIEQLAAEGITSGCGEGNYCPTNSVTRAQMAVLLLKTKHGPAFTPPPCSGLFADVACPSLFADWIEQLAAEQITGGCGGGNYCPGNPNTRAQMAVFLVKTFKM